MSIVFLSCVRRRCSALNKYCSNVSYVEKLLKCFLPLLTNYCLIEDTGIGAFICAQCRLLLLYSASLNNKAIWCSLTVFSRVCPCILYISLKITNFRCENLHDCTDHQ